MRLTHALRCRVSFWLAFSFLVACLAALFRFLEIPSLGLSRYALAGIFFVAFFLSGAVWSNGSGYPIDNYSEEEQRRRRIREKAVPGKKREYLGVLRTDIGVVQREFLEWRTKRRKSFWYPVFLNPIKAEEVRRHNFHCWSCQTELTVALPWKCRHCNHFHEDTPKHTIFDGCAQCGIHPKGFMCPFCNEWTAFRESLPKPVKVEQPEPVKAEEPVLYETVHIPFQERFAHTLIIAGTGWGKTQLMQLMAYKDIQAHSSVIIVDSQGQFLERVLKLRDKGDVIYIDFTDPENTPSLSMFAVKLPSEPRERERIYKGTLALYKYVFSSLLGAGKTPRQESLLSFISELMLEIAGANLRHIKDVLYDPLPFQKDIKKLRTDAREFFERQFPTKEWIEVRKQVMDRINAILSDTVLARVFSQSTSKIDLYRAINSGKVIVVNTAVSHLQSEGTSILGRFFVAMLFQAAVRRTGQEDKMKPAFLYIDEAWQYFDDNLSDMLKMIRKYRLGLILASQLISDFSNRSQLLRNAAFQSAVLFGGQMTAKEDKEMVQELSLRKDETTRNLQKEFVIENGKKKPVASEFYLRIQGQRGQLVKVPFYAMENSSQLTDEEYEEMLEENRERYCERVRVKGGRAPPDAPQGTMDEDWYEPDEQGVLRLIPKLKDKGVDDEHDFWNK